MSFILSKYFALNHKLSTANLTDIDLNPFSAG